MTSQQSGQNREIRKSSAKQPKAHKPLLQPESGSPMSKFNNAMRKILSVSKKDIKQK